MKAEEMLEEGINDGSYADITDQINVNTNTAFFKAIVIFAKDYASQFEFTDDEIEVLAKEECISISSQQSWAKGFKACRDFSINLK